MDATVYHKFSTQSADSAAVFFVVIYGVNIRCIANTSTVRPVSLYVPHIVQMVYVEGRDSAPRERDGIPHIPQGIPHTLIALTPLFTHLN